MQIQAVKAMDCRVDDNDKDDGREHIAFCHSQPLPHDVADQTAQLKEQPLLGVPVDNEASDSDTDIVVSKCGVNEVVACCEE